MVAIMAERELYAPEFMHNLSDASSAAKYSKVCSTAARSALQQLQSRHPVDVDVAVVATWMTPGPRNFSRWASLCPINISVRRHLRVNCTKTPEVCLLVVICKPAALSQSMAPQAAGTSILIVMAQSLIY